MVLPPARMTTGVSVMVTGPARPGRTRPERQPHDCRTSSFVSQYSKLGNSNNISTLVCP